MKKLLVLALVLGMATMANAALTVSIVSGPDTLNYGETGTYTVGYAVTGGDDLIASDIDIVSDIGTQPFSISGGLILTSNRTTASDYVGINTATGNYQVSMANDGGGTDLGSPLFQFVFTAPMSGSEAHLSLLENSFFNTNWEMYGVDIDAATLVGKTVTLVPEPMTMVLLGLGGLFLRRRK